MKRVLVLIFCLLSQALLFGREPVVPKKIQTSSIIKQGEENLLYPVLVCRFYELNGAQLFWFTDTPRAGLLQKQLIDLIDSSAYNGIAAKAYHVRELKEKAGATFSDSSLLFLADRIFTDAAIALFKDMYQGYKRKPWVGFDQVSEKYSVADDDYILKSLLSANAGNLLQAAESLEPADFYYKAMKTELKRHKERGKKDSVAGLLLSMSYYRWIRHFNFEKMIVVNLPAARLYYYEKGAMILNMKTVVGKPSTPTPRFAAWCDQAILYPYWYVPPSIIFNEYLPIIKNNPSWLDAKNMQVIDGSGKVLNHHRLNWSSFHPGYFPYSIRQSTGCDNALGVIKFNINTPYGVYLHDTNNKTAFLSGYRYFSHGCIRLEDPIHLGNRLLSDKLDTAFLQSCFKEQKPIFKPLETAVPVFVVYMPAFPDSKGKMIYYKDVYRLVK